MRVLAISPHTDDIEIWAAGMVLQYITNGDEVRHICLSPSYQSIPPEFNREITRVEFIKSQARLGIMNHHMYNFPVRRFSEHRQNILETLVDENEKFKPDLVITTSELDIHQDHQVVGAESLRAFYKCSIIQYVGRKAVPELNPNMIVMLTDEEWETKKRAIQCYKSQLCKQDYYTMMEDISKFYGKLYGHEWVEVFKVKKLIVR